MTRRLLFLWVLGYALIWTLITVYLDPAVPYDAVEALNWAQNAQWGSPKNPWLVGVMMRPALWLPSNVYWYTAHFLAIAAGMAGTWLLARRLSGSDRLAWLALLTLNLSGLINVDIISYNDNYLLVMLWPWMMLFYLLAITRNARWWLAFAVTAGLAAMAKYSSLAFIGLIFLSTLISPHIRSCYRRPVFYVALFIAAALIVPNLFWLWQHDFAAFRWVDSQIQAGLNPGLIITLLSVFYPLLFLGGMLYAGGARLHWPTPWAHRALLVIYLLPLLLISGWFLLHDGGRLTEWLQPFFILAPALMVGCARPVPECLARRYVVALFGAALVVVAGYAAVMYANIANAGQKMSGIIPFSHEMDRLWRDTYGTPLTYVGGDHLSQWLTFYVPSHPQTLTRWRNKTRPNVYNAHITYPQIVRHGALLVGKHGVPCSAETFGTVRRDWPGLRIDHVRQIVFQEDPAHTALPLCIAFVKPAP